MDPWEVNATERVFIRTLEEEIRVLKAIIRLRALWAKYFPISAERYARVAVEQLADCERLWRLESLKAERDAA